ncbi:LysR family transcriptional regulator [Alphaproteobacteria bacterium GH1-50]|uniref:LysR family transcriptional regulator n=1 Tax=Kangsaoukella pontilimi TaxID=2691042 RepID=A0A7C9IPR7_9RHOB|nr:LysR family transcriptional regulator [Kangsaoukella pontilimi]MXQ07043.1 LysR family transcriptional regulator [Kangsaoukella pontilimi]
MNWAAIRFDWNQVRAFLATAEEGSLSAAARALGLTQPTLGRQVTALEAHLGVPLFERVGKSLILTPSGQLLVEHVREMGEAATKLSLAASGQVQSVEGTVKITANEMVSTYALPEIVKGLREDHPGLVIEIVSTNSLSDLRRREADIAIRNAEPTDPDLIAKRIRYDSGGLFASEELARKLGKITEPKHLAGAPWLGFDETDEMIDALVRRGVPVTRENIVARSKSHAVHWEMARAGIGIGLNSNAVGQKTPGMVPILADKLKFEFPVWLVAPRELKTSRRVRIVYDRLAERLAAMD